MWHLYSISQIGLARLIALDGIVGQAAVGQIEKLLPGHLPERFDFYVMLDGSAEML